MVNHSIMNTHILIYISYDIPLMIALKETDLAAPPVDVCQLCMFVLTGPKLAVTLEETL